MRLQASEEQLQREILALRRRYPSDADSCITATAECCSQYRDAEAEMPPFEV